jgi:carboxyl-terminal processing protease
LEKVMKTRARQEKMDPSKQATVDEAHSKDTSARYSPMQTERGARPRMRHRIVSLLLVLGTLVVGPLSFDAHVHAATPEDKDYRLSSLSVLSRVVLLVKEQYVEPARIEPKVMLVSAMEAMEQKVPEVLVEKVKDDVLGLVVGTQRREYDLSGITSIWELNFKLRDIFRFVETRISPEVNRKEVEYAVINGMLSKLDPHSILLEPRSSKEMKLSTKGEFGGLGIVISIRDGLLTVISPIDGTPASRAGILAQDRIVKIGNESTINMGLDEAVERLRGKPNTKVEIWITRKGMDEPKKIVITRAIIKVDSVTHHLMDDRIGYVKVKQFQGRTTADVVEAISQMTKKAKGQLNGLILDLRNNPGGLLDQSVEISDLFLDDGVIVVTQEGGVRRERREIRAVRRAGKYKFPLVVLVNGGSASASEIVSGAIKNRSRGLIIGSQTFGKGSVQQLYDFPDNSSLKLTIGQYLTPGEESIQSVGITPDVEVSAMLADDADSVDLFPNAMAREEDLESHLDDSRTFARKPVEKVTFLSERLDEAELQRRATSSSFHDDFEIRMAHRVLVVTRGPKRSELLNAAKAVVEQVDVEEDRKVDGALKKLGLNWASGKTPKEVQLDVRLVDAKPVKAGEELSITLEVKNDGKEPLYRVKGITAATSNYFADREFLFGVLAPGEVRQWTQKLMIPKDVDTRMDLIRIRISDDDDRLLSSIDLPISIIGLERPRFSYTHYVDDSKGGNGDGRLQVGESAELVISIKNTGAGISSEPTASLKNLGGPALFIQKGRVQLEKIEPGDFGSARLAFKVQSVADEVKLRLQVFDGVMGDYLVEKIDIPITRTKDPVKKIKKTLITDGSDVVVRAAANSESNTLATLAPGTKVAASLSVAGYTRIALAKDLYGFVSTKSLKPAKGRVKYAEKGLLKGATWIFGRDPPRITFSGSDLNTPVTVAENSYELQLQIEDDDPIHDVYFFVGTEKVFYRRTAQDKKKKVLLKFKVDLQPGVNSITVVAREKGDFSQREVLSVFSKAGDPLAKKRSISTH